MDDQPPSEKKSKILIIRFSSIGDIVLTTPVIRALHQQIPNTEIHYLVKKEHKIVIEANPYIDKIYTYQKKDHELITQLVNEKYDLVIDLHKNNKSKSIVKLLHTKSYTFHKLNFKKWVYVYFKIQTLPLKHLVDRYFEALQPLGIINDQEGLDFPIPDSEKFDIDNLPAVLEDGYVAVTLGSIHGTKRIPAEKIIEISKIIHKPVILLGGKDVSSEGEWISSHVNDRIFNYCGKLNLYQSASLIQNSSCLLACDTGLMHIGAALQVPIAVMWGNTVPEFGMYPYMPQNPALFRSFENTTLLCRPCSKLGYKKCPKKHFKCMISLDTQEIADWINTF